MLKILDPTGETQAPSLTLNPMPSELSTVTIGLVDNAKVLADLVLGHLAASIPGASGEVVTVKKRSEAAPAPPEDLDRLASQVHIAVGGLAE